MEYREPTESYSGQVREITLGKGGGALKIGGENTLAYHDFEGSIPNPPRFALEVYDMEPKGWVEWILEPFKDVVSDPVKWAKKCVDEFGAEAVLLRLVSADPAEKDTSPEEAAALAKKVAEAVSVPLIVCTMGSDDKKDAQVLQKVAEVCKGENLLLGPALKENYEEIGKAALDYGHMVIAQTPMDINLMKELNIKLCKLLPAEKIVIDPLTSALGYGMEYSFTLMERTKQIGVQFKDAMTQMPIIADLGNECWKTKQAKESREQALLWEGMTALSMLLAGANIVVVRHPETLKLIREITRKGA